jgi:hypothetical protein
LEDALTKVAIAVGSERLSAVNVNFRTVEVTFGFDFFKRLLITRPLPVIVISLDILGCGRLRGLLVENYQIWYLFGICPSFTKSRFHSTHFVLRVTSFSKPFPSPHNDR